SQPAPDPEAAQGRPDAGGEGQAPEGPREPRRREGSRARARSLGSGPVRAVRAQTQERGASPPKAARSRNPVPRTLENPGRGYSDGLLAVLMIRAAGTTRA